MSHKKDLKIKQKGCVSQKQKKNQLTAVIIQEKYFLLKNLYNVT